MAEERKPISSFQWLIDAEEHLLLNNWEKQGVDSRNIPMFRDPKGRDDNGTKIVKKKDPKTGIEHEVWDAVATRDIEITKRDGTKETWSQILLPAGTWVYSLEEAHAIQLQRDQEEKTAKENPAPVESSKPASPINPNVRKKVG